jgi:hypothetical protein
MAVADSSLIQKGRKKQQLDDGNIHRWYRFVLAFPDCLVTEMCERFNVAQGDIVFDPFCGTGTTLVECQKMGLNAIGLEANPACVFASRIKTTWDVDTAHLRVVLEEIIERVRPIEDELTFSAQPLFAGMFNAGNLKKRLLANSPEGQYFVSSGMLKRGWLSEIPFYKVLALLEEIKGLKDKDEVQDALRLALAAIVVETASNVSFGPEIYVSGHKDDVDVLGAFRAKVEVMISDLETIQATFPAGRSLAWLKTTCSTLTLSSHLHLIPRKRTILDRPGLNSCFSDTCTTPRACDVSSERWCVHTARESTNQTMMVNGCPMYQRYALLPTS